MRYGFVTFDIRGLIPPLVLRRVVGQNKVKFKYYPLVVSLSAALSTQ